jgi:hypothetical protein
MFYFASGAIWTKMKTNFDWWEVDIIFRVTGRGRIGADGLVCIGTLVGSMHVRVVFSDKMGSNVWVFLFTLHINKKSFWNFFKFKVTCQIMRQFFFSNYLLPVLFM